MKGGSNIFLDHSYELLWQIRTHTHTTRALAHTQTHTHTHTHLQILHKLIFRYVVNFYILDMGKKFFFNFLKYTTKVLYSNISHYCLFVRLNEP